MDIMSGRTMFVIVTFICYGLLQQGSFAYIFNSSSLNFLQSIQYKFCGSIIQCDKSLTFSDGQSKDNFESHKNIIPISVPPRFDPSCCLRCSCNLSTCQEHGTCCTDILTPEIVRNETYSRLTCEAAQLRPRNVEIQNGDMIWMRRKCPKGFVSDAYEAVIKNKCENWMKYPGLDTRVPVTDLTSNITYHNKYCLRCNHISAEKAVVWNARLLCSTEEEGTVLQNLDGDNILESLEATETCNIIYERPEDRTFPISYCTLGIDQCNVTGRWAVYDPFIEAACHMFTTLYVPSLSYKNVFCYMCNEIVTPDICSQGVDKGVLPLFSSLLKYTGEEAHETNDTDTFSCTQSQIYDKIKKTCRNISCRFPKALKNGQCVNMVETLAGVSYLMYIKFTPINTTEGADLFYFTNFLRTVVDDKLKSWGIQTFVENFFVLYKIQTSENNTTNTTSPGIYTSTEPMHPAQSDVKEDTSPAKSEKSGNTDIVNNFGFNFPTPPAPPAPVLDITLPQIPVISINDTISYIMFRIGFYINAETDYINISVLDDILDIEQEYIAIKDSTGIVKNQFNVILKDYSFSDFTVGRDVNISDMDDNSTLEVFSVTHTTNVDTERNKAPVVIAEKLVCPLVHVDTKDDHWINIVNNALSIYETRIERKYFYDVPLENTGNYSYYLICVDKFLQALENYENTEEDKVDEQIAKRILSFLFVMASVLCALLTLVTYCLFKELRTQPGLNNMCLVSNLIIAQLLFQFGSNQAALIPNWACKTIGVLVHFFWLMVIFWMNVCTFHMFIVFGQIRQVTNQQVANRLKLTLKYTVYCVFSSALFVVINIAVESVSSHNESIGYGYKSCYISSRDMIGYVFALPIFLVIFINLALFFTVVFKISRLPTIDSSVKSNRNYFSIYAKLASITGITWMTGVLMYFTDIELFEYAFIIFNAGQGVFIFLSFVCNKRVLRRYKTLLKEQKPSQTRNKSKTTRETTFSSSKRKPSKD